MHVQLFIAFVTYFSILLGIGLLSYRKQSSDADFIVGGRSLNFWLTAFSAQASDMSAWLFMAYPGQVFSEGLPAIWIAVGLTVGMFLNWHFIAPKLRIATEQYNSYTLSTFFERRFSDQSGVLRLTTAIISILFLTSYLSSGLIAMGLLLDSVLGINFYVSTTVATLVAVIYTFMGGFITIAWTDLFQALFLLAAILIVPILGYFELGQGSGEILKAASDQSISLSVFPVDAGYEFFFSALFLTSWGLGYFGQPHILTKFMGIKNPGELYKSKYLGISWQIVVFAAATLVGLVGIGYFPESLSNPELVFVSMVKALFSPYFAGIILCGLMAATMSTMDSQILVCASIFSEDFYQRFFRKNASKWELLWISRLGVILIALIALLLAYEKSTTIMDLVFYAWSGLGCSFGPLLLVSLYSNRITKYGAFAGIVVGAGVVGVWSLVNPYITSLKVPAMIPGFLLSLIAIYLFSRFSKVENASLA